MGSRLLRKATLLVGGLQDASATHTHSHLVSKHSTCTIEAHFVRVWFWPYSVLNMGTQKRCPDRSRSDHKVVFGH